MGDSEETLVYFKTLGELVEQRWTAQGRRSERLPAIATAALQDIPVPSGLTPELILDLLATGRNVPKQRPSSDIFGQPPAVMYRGESFQIQALTWMEGTTSTHQHGFDGAFRVVWGSSLHVKYSFQQAESLADGHLVAGELTMIQAEALWKGDVRPIVSGPAFIHSLFHLERPSMTVVVRNGSSGHSFPQYDYRLPGLGFDVLYEDDRLRMRMRGLHSLYRLDRDRAGSVALGLAATEELWTAYRICDDWALSYGEGSVLTALTETLATRAAIFAELLPPMYTEEIRRGRLLARRGMLRESRHRLFLALIVNLPGRSSIHDVMGQIFPGKDSSQLIADLVEELASPEYRGISGLSLSADELAQLKCQLLTDGGTDLLGGVATRWKPPSLLESLFT